MAPLCSSFILSSKISQKADHHLINILNIITLKELLHANYAMCVVDIRGRGRQPSSPMTFVVYGIVRCNVAVKDGKPRKQGPTLQRRVPPMTDYILDEDHF